MKRNSIILSLALAVVFTLGSVSLAIGTDWTDHFEQAKAKAASEGKDLLVDFTGSDWCGWCIRLDKEVFQKELFKTQAPKEFVLVALDYPRDKSKVSEEITEQNSKLKAHYGIRGYPTIYLMDASGRPYAKTGYQAGGAEAYLAHLAELRNKHKKRDDHLAAAKGADTDLSRAKSVDKALEAMGITLATQFYKAEIEQIIASDPDNKAGLKTKYEQLAFDQKMTALLGQGKTDDAAQALESTLTAWNLPQSETHTLKTKYEQQIFDAKISGLMRKRQHDEAIALIQTQIKSKRLKGKALIDMQLTIVSAYSMKKDYDTAMKTVDAIMEKNQLLGPSLQDVWEAKARVYRAKDDTEKMTQALKEAIKAAPETPKGKGMQRFLDRMKDSEKK